MNIILTVILLIVWIPQLPDILHFDEIFGDVSKGLSKPL